jgi:putative exporter of polyketide antibiotics
MGNHYFDGDLETGTADILYSLPVSRLEVFLSNSVACFFVLAILSFCPLLGVWIGTNVLEMEQAISMFPFIIVATNFLFLNLAIACLSLMVGCILNRRSVAVGVIVGVVFVSAVLNFLEPFIPLLENVQFLSLLGYFRPVDVLRAETWPTVSIGALGLIAATTWIAGLTILIRRDIPTA